MYQQKQNLIHLFNTGNQKLPQINTLIALICIRKVAWFAVYICDYLWSTQYHDHDNVQNEEDDDNDSIDSDEEGIELPDSEQTRATRQIPHVIFFLSDAINHYARLSTLSNLVPSSVYSFSQKILSIEAFYQGWGSGF